MKDKPIYICITPFFPSPGNWRGAYVLDQVKAIQRNSEYEVVVMKPSSLLDKSRSYEMDGIKVHLFPTLQTPSYLFNGFFNGFNGRAFVKKVKALGIDLMRVRFVHTHTGPFAVYGLALRKVAPHIKVFVQHHDLDPFTIRNGKWAHWKPNAIYRAKNSIRLFNEVDLHICISKPVKDNLLVFPRARDAEIYEPYLDALKPLADMPSIHPRDTYILYNGVDTRLFNTDGGKLMGENLGMSSLSGEKKFIIGCIGNLGRVKDQESVVRAFCSLHEKGYSDMRLVLLGTGHIKAKLLSILEEHHLSAFVEWPPEVVHDKLPDLYRKFDIFVLPSIYEGFGCVYTEAYACGVPFICCYDQGAAECVAPEERDKWLVKPLCPEQIEHQILRFYDKRDKQKLCQPHDIDVLISNFINYIERLR